MTSISDPSHLFIILFHAFSRVGVESEFSVAFNLRRGVDTFLMKLALGLGPVLPQGCEKDAGPSYCLIPLIEADCERQDVLQHVLLSSLLIHLQIGFHPTQLRSKIDEI
ncbi:hypothetical protein Adt_15077 [Abeliophyllum distichum]|uniref:Uncharacterized protein n=1 Tax=Abeliophyllum distichum TaxID=126358 RepID=A0ABD1U1G8_9LAMI